MMKKLLMGLLLVAAIGAVVYFKMNKGCGCDAGDSCCQ